MYRQLYIMGSSTLVLQCVYYEHLLPWYKQNWINKSKDHVVSDPLLHPASSGSDLSRSISVQVSPARRICLESGSALSGSPSSPAVKHFNSVGDQNHGTPPDNDCLINQSLRVLKTAASYGTFVAAAASLTHQSNASFPVRMENYMSNDRRNDAAYGQLSGWLMASIYIMGRIPQIWLNIEKGSVEGLNPLLFSFTLVANATYLASILVRSTKWEKIKPELPWLLDASMCGTLDIIVSFFYIPTLESIPIAGKTAGTSGEDRNVSNIERKQQSTLHFISL
uniref:PQ-loop repeat family protein / transmembrane family protein n=1 Tax=Kalanchoe fedtschenkoi TaxID=63787 RepID=A0A7N0TQX3_KALFE